MSGDLPQRWPVGAGRYVFRATAATTEPRADLRHGILRTELSQQPVRRQVGVMATPIAPAKNVHAALDQLRQYRGLQLPIVRCLQAAFEPCHLRCPSQLSLEHNRNIYSGQLPHREIGRWPDCGLSGWSFRDRSSRIAVVTASASETHRCSAPPPACHPRWPGLKAHRAERATGP